MLGAPNALLLPLIHHRHRPGTDVAFLVAPRCSCPKTLFANMFRASTRRSLSGAASRPWMKYTGRATASSPNRQMRRLALSSFSGFGSPAKMVVASQAATGAEGGATTISARLAVVIRTAALLRAASLDILCRLVLEVHTWLHPWCAMWISTPRRWQHSPRARWLTTETSDGVGGVAGANVARIRNGRFCQVLEL